MDKDLKEALDVIKYLRASLQLARAGLNVAVLSKVFPTRSHTVAAQGGIGASLGNMSEDNWHFRRTCLFCGRQWRGLHCPHDGYQNPCPHCGKRPDAVVEGSHAEG